MMDANVKLVSQAGRIVCMGIDLREASYDMLQVSIKEASIVGSRMQQKRFPAVIANCWDYLKVADRLVTDRFPFAQAEEAMKLAAKAAPRDGKGHSDVLRAHRKEYGYESYRYSRPMNVAVEEQPSPQIEKANQVIVRVKAAGICGSDLHTLVGR